MASQPRSSASQTPTRVPSYNESPRISALSLRGSEEIEDPLIAELIRSTNELAATLTPGQLRLAGETYLYVGQRLIDQADLLTD